MKTKTVVFAESEWLVIPDLFLECNVLRQSLEGQETCATPPVVTTESQSRSVVVAQGVQ